MTRRLFASLLCLGAALAATPAPETAPLQPRARERVPPPFAPLAIDGSTIAARDRRCDLGGVIPRPRVGSRDILSDAAVRLDGQALSPPALTWTLRSPGAAAAERRWQHGPWTIQTSYAVDYDGFITLDLTLSPAAPTTLSSLTLDLGFTPAAARLYQVPAWGPTRAGAFPASAEVATPAPGVWVGAESAGLGIYVASFRDWRGPGAWLTLAREGTGGGLVRLAVVRGETTLAAPTTWRFGFIATPVVPPDPRHWQLYSISTTAEDLLHLAPNALIWSGLSDHYATFSTNDPAGDPARRNDVERLHAAGRRVLAYTTYAHVEEGDVEVPEDWCLYTLAGRRHAQPVGPGSKARRLYCCPGSAAWVDWKTADLEAAMERYGVDGFYVDTSYVITACSNAAHDHGWTDPDGTRHGDFLVWSMREVWRRAWETIAARRGQAAIYAHHKSGCPPALAGYTSAFCDGEQYTGSSIRQLTLDAFQAQDAGRPIGPTAFFIEQYFRSALFGLREKGEHHNPAESVMLALLHDVLPVGHPGFHPLRELLALRDDLGIADAAWTPYHAADNPWRVEGATDLVCSSYRTARGDTLVVVGNPTYAPLDGRLAGPPEATAGRQALQIDVLARIGRRTAFTPGYRWEPSPEYLTVPARSLVLAAFVRDPDTLEPFRRQRGFFRVDPVPRREPVPDGWALLADHDDPDWILASDRGTLTATDRNPVDSRRALRVEPRPLHASAALMLEFTEPRDWSGATALSLWVRPDRPFPLKAFDLRLRHRTGYTPAARLAAPADLTELPAGVWTRLIYAFDDLPRQAVRAVRLYTNRQDLGAGAFDLDEVLLDGLDRPADPAAAAAAAAAPAAAVPAPAPTPAPATTATDTPAVPTPTTTTPAAPTAPAAADEVPD